MSIQGAINQSVGTGALLYTQSEGFKHQKEVKSAAREVKTITEIHKKLADLPDSPENEALKREYMEKGFEAVKRVGELQPNKMSNVVKLRQSIDFRNKIYDEFKAAQANARAQEQQKAASNIKTAFQTNINKWGTL